jgi:hypothetical protein
MYLLVLLLFVGLRVLGSFVRVVLFSGLGHVPDALVDVVGHAVVHLVPVGRLVVVVVAEVRLRKVELGLAVEKAVAPVGSISPMLK